MANCEILLGLYKIVSLACTCGFNPGSAKDGSSQNSPTCVKQKKKKKKMRERIPYKTNYSPGKLCSRELIILKSKGPIS